MSTAVVITALNHGRTIIESIESVLSQTTLPDSIGLALGPSRDTTEEMAEFYREEFDFIHYDSSPMTHRCGRMHLRLGCLQYLESDHVIFLAADSYLLPQTVELVSDDLAGDQLGIGSVDCIDQDGNMDKTVPPMDSDIETLLETGPLHPANVIWPRQKIIDLYSKFQALKLGSLSTLGWLVLSYSDGQSITFFEETVAETSIYEKESFCMTVDDLRSLVNLREQLLAVPELESFASRIEKSLEEIEPSKLPPGFLDDYSISSNSMTETLSWISRGFADFE